MRHLGSVCLALLLLAGCSDQFFTTFWPWEFGDVEEAFIVRTPAGFWVYCPAYVLVENEEERYVLDETGDYFHDFLSYEVEYSRWELEDLLDDGAPMREVEEHERFSEIPLEEAVERADFVARYWPAELVPVDEWYREYR